MENPENNDEFFDKIEIFSSEDDKLKFLGELLSNESSRQILLLLTNQEMSANELSEKTNLRLSLVIHHLNKMQQVGIVKIVKTEKNTKNRDMKYYSAKSGIMIFPKEISEKITKSKSLSISLTKIVRFSAIGIAGIASWLMLDRIFQTELDLPLMRPVELSTIPEGTYWATVLSLTIIIIGLVTEQILDMYLQAKKSKSLKI